jgi:CBS domain-containing protein
MFRYFKDLDKLANALYVKHFATMDSELEYVNSQDLAIEVLAWMEANDFNIVPVIKDGGKSFFIDREKDLTDIADGEIIANRMKPITFSELVRPDVLIIKDALIELSERGWFFVGSNRELQGIVTLADLGKPAVSFYLLSHLLMLEAGLRRLLGSYTSKPMPDAAIENGESFTNIINRVKKEKPLRLKLGFDSNSQFGNYTGFMGELRNALAHGRSILTKAGSVKEATGYIENIDSLLKKVGELINDKNGEDDVWNKFAETRVVKPTKQNWAGTSAISNLPMNPPIYVISAANPLEEVLSSEENKRRHLGLHNILESRKLKFEEVFGESPCGGWSEASFAIEGMSKKDACELAEKFRQRAIFELTQDEIRVISVDGECQKTQPRCR